MERETHKPVVGTTCWWECKVCGGVYAYEDPKKHAGPVTLPNCMDDGHCAACGADFDEDPNNHVGPIIPATCVSLAHCDACGFDFGNYDANNHVGPVTPATCVSLAHCDACGFDFGDNYDANNHAHITTPATCVSPGHCAACGANLDLDPNNHAGPIIPATCVRGAYCEACGLDLSDCDYNNHEGHITSITPNCLGSSYCDACGQYFGDKDPNNHVGPFTPATCVSESYCQACYEYFGDKDPNNHDGHLAEVKATPASCTEPGTAAHWECSSCKKLYSDRDAKNETTLKALKTEPLGHDWSEWTLNASGTSYTRSCKRDGCGAKETAGAAANAPVTETAPDGTSVTSATTVFQKDGRAVVSVDIALATESTDLTAAVDRDFETAVSADVKVSVAEEGWQFYALSLDVTGLPDGLSVTGGTTFKNVPLDKHDFTLKLSGKPTAVADKSEVKISATVTVDGDLPKLKASAEKTVSLTVSKDTPEEPDKPESHDVPVPPDKPESSDTPVTPESHDVPVVVSVENVTLNRPSAELTVGGTLTLTATVTPSNATNKTVTWKSDKKSVATVSNTGVVTAISVGTANITVMTTDGGKTAVCAVTVKPKPEPAPAPAPKPEKPSDELTQDQKAAQEKAEAELKQETAEKAKEAEKAAGTVDTRTESGKALADLMSGKNAEGSKSQEEQQATQAAALEVKEVIEKSGLEVSDLTADEIKAAVENKEQEKQDAVYEASGEVKDTTVPAATDLLAKSENKDLKEANEKLSVQPKLVEPEVLDAESAKKADKNIKEAANGEQKVDEDVDLDAVKAAANEGLQTDIKIESADKELAKQAEAVEKVFNAVSADLAGANDGKGVVIAVTLPKMTPKLDGFYPLRVNHRHLIHGQCLRFWPSVEYFQQQAQGKAAGVELASAGKEGDYFFLDQNNVPTAVVSGDPAQMTAVACLLGGKTYDGAFITADATEQDQATLMELKEKANPNPGSDKTPTSDKDGGGCSAGFGALAAAALCGAVFFVRKRR